jgi:hypothetical protein
VRAYVPSLIFTSIFGTIVVDVFCTLGPLFPFANYFLVNSVLISASCGIAIAVIVSIFVFPQSANHLYLDATCDLLGKLSGLAKFHDAILKAAPEDLSADSPITKQLSAARVGLIRYHTERRCIFALRLASRAHRPGSATSSGLPKRRVQLWKMEWGRREGPGGTPSQYHPSPW